LARNIRYVHKHGNSLVVAVPVRLRKLLQLEPGTPIFWSNPEKGVLQIRNVKKQMELVGRE